MKLAAIRAPGQDEVQISLTPDWRAGYAVRNPVASPSLIQSFHEVATIETTYRAAKLQVDGRWEKPTAVKL